MGNFFSDSQAPTPVVVVVEHPHLTVGGAPTVARATEALEVTAEVTNLADHTLATAWAYLLALGADADILGMVEGDLGSFMPHETRALRLAIAVPPDAVGRLVLHLADWPDLRPG